MHNLKENLTKDDLEVLAELKHKLGNPHNPEETKTALDELFDDRTETLNGDVAFVNVGNLLVDILFKTEYLRNHLDELPVIEPTVRNQIFSMMIRDPRYGFGQKNVGRSLMVSTGVSLDEMLIAGRGDDLLELLDDSTREHEVAAYLYEEASAGNHLVLKWLPRLPKHNKELDPYTGEIIKKKFTESQMKTLQRAKKLMKAWNMNRQQYSHFIKTETVEKKLTEKRYDDIIFDHVPSLASVRYSNLFKRLEETKQRYSEYLDGVKSGDRKLHASVTTVYDIYKQARKDNKFDADAFLNQLETISGSFLCICDVSSSMLNNDALGKALSITYYLSMCSTYCNGQFVTFSLRPQLVSITGNTFREKMCNISRADWDMNTDLSKVMEMLKGLQATGGDFPQWLVIISDMNFDKGSNKSMKELMKIWHRKGWPTKIIWWNVSAINAVCPEKVDDGNIFMSGYSPMLLKYLQAGFDAYKFLESLINGYAAKISKTIEEEKK